jgi:hypothetical protein
VDGLPAGATASFSPNPVTGSPSWASTLSVTTAGTTPTGTYPLTITGTDGTLTRTATASLVVQPPATPDFALSISPSSRMVRPNGTTTYTIGIARSGGFAHAVDLSVAGLPAGATPTFSQDPAAPGTSQVILTVKASSTKGSFTVTVTGTAGSLTRSVSALLKVNGK